jgi:hypothetical protein
MENEGAWELVEMLDEDYYRDKVKGKMCVYRGV